MTGATVRCCGGHPHGKRVRSLRFTARDAAGAGTFSSEAGTFT